MAVVGRGWRGWLALLVQGREVAGEGGRWKLWNKICINIVVFAVRRLVQGALVLIGGSAGRWTRARERRYGGHVVQADAAECGCCKWLDGREAADVVDGGLSAGGIRREF